MCIRDSQHGTHRGRNRYHPSAHTTKDEAPGQLPGAHNVMPIGPVNLTHTHTILCVAKRRGDEACRGVQKLEQETAKVHTKKNGASYLVLFGVTTEKLK